MLSKNNFHEKIRQMEEKKERFSIRKFTIGAASVLIGFTFMGLGVHTVQADAPANGTEQEEENSNSTAKLGGGQKTLLQLLRTRITRLIRRIRLTIIVTNTRIN